MTVERIANTDFQTLNELKLKSRTDAKEALPEVAKQFEGIFLQSLLKTMRMSQHFIDDSSPFRGKDTETFQEMLDGQYVSKITSSSQGIGIADILTKQLGGTLGKTADKQLEIGKIDTIGPLGKPAVTDIKPFVNKVAGATPATETATAATAPTTTIDDFVKSVWSKAKEAAASMGLDPKILIAQAALETGWGHSVAKDANGSSSNNLFNIKSGTNSDFESIKIKTTEYIADTPIKVSASFRKYASVEDSFNDYVSLIKSNSRYQNALANSGNPERYVNELSKAGYAMDPNYGTKILSIYHSEELNEAVNRCGLSSQI